MNTQNLSTLQAFQSFSHKCKISFFQSCRKHFVQFLCECIINLLNGNLQSIKKHHVAKFQSVVRLLFLKRTTWKQRRDLLASKKSLQLIKVITRPVVNHLSWYGAVCHRSWFCVQQEEINKKIFFKADSLVDKILSCPRIKVSESQTLILDGEETRISLLDFPQQLRCKNVDIPDIYFTLLDAASISPTLILNQNAKAEERRSWVPSKIWTSEAAKLYTQGGAAYGSVRNLVKAGTLSVSKVRQFLHSKPPYTKFTLVTREFKQTKSFAIFKNEIWCMDLAYVDKLARDNNGVKYLLVRQDLFDRTVDSKGMKTKDSKEMVRTFLTMITKKNRP